MLIAGLRWIKSQLFAVGLRLGKVDICSPGLTLYKKFSRSVQGNVAILFAIVLVPIISAVGMSIDYSSAVSARQKIQTALDASALAAGRVLQVSGSRSEAEAAAVRHFNSTINSGLKAVVSVENIDTQAGLIKLSGAASVPTNFMAIVGVKSINVTTASTVEFGKEKNVEISMMLDITGSMYGSKITDLKIAAKDLVQIIMQSSEAAHMKTRIALVPFSESVNVRKYAEEVADSGKIPGSLLKVAKACVTERTGDEAFTDAAPKGQNKVGKLINLTGQCEPSNELVPLTDDKNILESAIEKMNSASGYTAGHLGTSWAWYTLSPNWRTVWPNDSRPAEYGDGTEKYAILMTDGEYNVEYYKGIMSWYVGTPSPNGSSDAQADRLCANMKAAGITVYTVGFELDSTVARSTLRECASSESHYFLASNGDELRTAFRQIAFRIAQLRISR